MTPKLLLFVLAALLLLAGCTQQSQGLNLGDPYVGGPTGLETEFLTNSPPDEVFDNNEYPFSVSVRLNNIGEYDLESNEGFVEIKGISAAEFGVSQSALKQPLPEIRGARKDSTGNILKGSPEVITFDGLKYVADLAGNLPISSLRVRTCYDYETESSTLLCIKEDNVDGLRDNEICLVNELKNTANSGAPIHVTNVQETTRGSSGIQVSFDVAHVGAADNKWFLPGDNNCDEKISNTESLYKVEVDVTPIVNGRYSAKCSGGTFNGGNNGIVTLFNGEARTITCSFDIGDEQSDFETRSNINLRYRYSQFIEKPLLIRDLGNSE
jgi:hypothetical protein